MKIRKYANCIERFLGSDKGQRFFNIAYSLGAAIIIWGALFMILHLPGGRILLCVGMGTEVLMFVLTAFDRPPREFAQAAAPEAQAAQADVRSSRSAQTPARADISDSALSESVSRLAATADALEKAGASLLKCYGELSLEPSEISGESAAYAGNLADLNRNIAGLNTIYGIQLKSISGQLDTIDRVNKSMKDIRDMYEKSAGESERYCEETEKMTRHMQQLNAVYEKMLVAMTAGMRPSGAAFPGSDAGAAGSDAGENDGRSHNK